MRLKLSLITLVLCFSVMMLIPVNVWSQPGNRRNGPPMKPPQEAFDACNGKSNGDTCTVVTPRGDNISGTCRTPKGQQLVCVPDNAPQRDERQRQQTTDTINH